MVKRFNLTKLNTIIFRGGLQLSVLVSPSFFEARAQDVRVDSVGLNEVVVTGTRNATDIRHLPQTITVVGREVLTENERPNVLPTLMEQVPGLMITGRGMMGYGISTGGTGGMMLRGISSGAGQVMVLIDGHPQYNGIYGHSIADAYQTMMAERVEVLRGPASMLYGSNAMGGVVNIVTRKTHTGVFNEDYSNVNISLGAGSWGTLQGDISYKARKGKFSALVAASTCRTDNHRRNMGFDQNGAFAKVNFDINDSWNLYADLDLTRFNASYPGTVSDPMLEADQWITRGAVAIGVENHYEKMSGRASLYDNFGRHKINDGYKAVGGKPQNRLFRSKDELLGVSIFEALNLLKGNTITLGFDYQSIYGHAYYTSREDGKEMETQNKQSGEERNTEIAGYVDARQDITDFLTIDLGVRYDHHTVTGSEWVPQAGLVVRPMSNGEVKVMASKGFRNPTMREMYLYPPSNTDLLPERMWNYELSWRHRINGNGYRKSMLTYGVNVFYIKANNIIQTINKKNVNTGELENWGIEMDALWKLNKHFSITTNHSWLNMKHEVVSAPKYKGYIGAATHLGSWNCNIGLTHVNELFTALATEKDPATTESFTLLNAMVGYTISPYLRLWVRGENMLAQKYEFVAGMPMPRATFMAGVNLEF